ncbi:MAG: hypothetical protein AB7P12_15295 [Alphaproteobacteria bacterium]
MADYGQYKFRLRAGLGRKLEAAAQRNEQTLNAEAAARLESSFDKEEAEYRFASAIETLAGGGENAKLLKLVTTALQLATAGARDKAAFGPMRVFATAVSEIALSHAGGRSPGLVEKDFESLDNYERQGVFLADVLLRQEGMPPVLDPEWEKHLTELAAAENKRSGLSLAKLGNFRTLADLGKRD